MYAGTTQKTLDLQHDTRQRPWDHRSLFRTDVRRIWWAPNADDHGAPRAWCLAETTTPHQHIQHVVYARGREIHVLSNGWISRLAVSEFESSSWDNVRNTYTRGGRPVKARLYARGHGAPAGFRTLVCESTDDGVLDLGAFTPELEALRASVWQASVGQSTSDHVATLATDVFRLPRRIQDTCVNFSSSHEFYVVVDFDESPRWDHLVISETALECTLSGCIAGGYKSSTESMQFMCGLWAPEGLIVECPPAPLSTLPRLQATCDTRHSHRIIQQVDWLPAWLHAAQKLRAGLAPRLPTQVWGCGPTKSWEHGVSGPFMWERSAAACGALGGDGVGVRVPLANIRGWVRRLTVEAVEPTAGALPGQALEGASVQLFAGDLDASLDACTYVGEFVRGVQDLSVSTPALAALRTRSWQTCDPADVTLADAAQTTFDLAGRVQDTCVNMHAGVPLFCVLGSALSGAWTLYATTLSCFHGDTVDAEPAAEWAITLHRALWSSTCLLSRPTNTVPAGPEGAAIHERFRRLAAPL